jgi:hypothetical protein
MLPGRELPGSNLGCKIGYPFREFRAVPQSLSSNAGVVALK